MEFPKQRISASLVNSYINCPYAFYLTVVLELQQKEGPALKMGSMFDEMFKAYHKNKDPYNSVKTHKDKEGNLDLWSNPPTKQQVEHFGLCRELIEAYKKSPDKFAKPVFDKGFGVPLIHPSTREELEFPVSGYLDGLDFIDEERVINGIEVKTTSENWTQFRVDREIQATMYIYYMYYTYGELYPLNYIVFNKNTLEIQRFTTTRKLVDFALLFDTLKEFIANVRAERFNKNPGHAYYCACRNLG